MKAGRHRRASKAEARLSLRSGMNELTLTLQHAEELHEQVQVTATRNGKDLGSSLTHVRASAGDNEYFDAAMRAPLLKRIAEALDKRIEIRFMPIKPLKTA